MSRNIVICCDGTGNEVGSALSNVLKLFRVLEKSESQHVYYHPGVGTIGLQSTWQRRRQEAIAIVGLATGLGLDEDVLRAYRWLCRTYDPASDRIWLFGFSRGAYTVRVLAAFVHVMGIMPSDQLDLAGYAFTAYKKASSQSQPSSAPVNSVAPVTVGRKASSPTAIPPANSPFLEAAWDFSRIVGCRPATIDFIGVWDTVASVIVPGGRGLLPSLQMLRFTRTNPSVRVFRQAMAIDERRRMFRLNAWTDPQIFRPDPFDRTSDIAQDSRQVWFAGVHADVGGGYPEGESGLSKFPLRWMIQQARAQDLLVDDTMIDHLVEGHNRAGSRHNYAPPDADACLHTSMTAGWKPLEWLPKRTRWRETDWGASLFGWYLPRCEPRRIPEGAVLHHSVVRRMQTRADYRPPNVPGHYQLEEEPAP